MIIKIHDASMWLNLYASGMPSKFSVLYSKIEVVGRESTHRTRPHCDILHESWNDSRLIHHFPVRLFQTEVDQLWVCQFIVNLSCTIWNLLLFSGFYFHVCIYIVNIIQIYCDTWRLITIICFVLCFYLIPSYLTIPHVQLCFYLKQDIFDIGTV